VARQIRATAPHNESTLEGHPAFLKGSHAQPLCQEEVPFGVPTPLTTELLTVSLAVAAETRVSNARHGATGFVRKFRSGPPADCHFSMSASSAVLLGVDVGSEDGVHAREVSLSVGFEPLDQ
jgi:hypothetical protein